MKKSLIKLSTLLMIMMLLCNLTACKKEENKTVTNDIDILSAEANSAEEASQLFNLLLQKENEILGDNSALWEKVFLNANKNSTMIEDGTNYGDFLLGTIEAIKDEFNEDELKTLRDGANKIKEIEGKLTILEQKYPGCGTVMPGNGDSVSAEDAGMKPDSDVLKFPSFKGKDLDGNDVTSEELFAQNKVTVVNFWFTACKPCVEELADLEALNQKVKEMGGEVIGINSFTLDGDETAILEAKDVLSKKNATFRNIYFPSDSEAGQFTASLFSYPSTYVVDKNGNIIGQPIIGGITSDEQAKLLEEYINLAIANN
mgnify:FL=1